MSVAPLYTPAPRDPARSFQDMILTLHDFWSHEAGCVILQPYDMRMGAGTFHTATTLRALGPEPWNAAFVQPCRRPTDGRYGENPNRLQHYYQYQVILKPSPSDIQELYLKSLAAIGIDPLAHDIRFVEDDWESPTLGAWGLGWEVWCDGMEVTQFTYFQQMGGFDCKPVAGELTYGLERLAMYIQGVDNVYDLAFNSSGVSYGEVFLENERQMSKWNFEVANTDALFDLFAKAEAECRNALSADVPLAAYEQAIEASHVFNLLQARGVISVQERASYMGRVRDLARSSCEAYAEKMTPEWQAKYPGVESRLMADFLLELRCEEIPARMQAGARAELEKLFRRELEAAGVKHDNLRIWSTPRRLALIAYDLPAATEAVSEEAKGPPEGAPDAAIDGFCKKAGVTRDQLELRDVKGRMTYFAVIEQPGRAMAEVLAAAIPAIIRDFSWPKSMRWGAASITTDSIRWVRPLSGIIALLDGKVIDVEVGGIRSGRETMGHRFHHSGAVAIESAHTYAGQLLDARVIVEHTKREALIRQGAADAAAAAGLTLVADEGLVIENAGLTENPVPLLGRFDEAFLDVPPEVIQLTARVNQKYFVCEDFDGKLANAFVCTANIDPLDPAVVVDGNRKVLAARLSDARFFWEQDQKTPLAVHAKKLARITFHEKLGTVADKALRVALHARGLLEEEIVAGDPDLAEQAARLCKADLVTEMVGEFPELQGLMGGYYAAKEGLPQEVAEAIRDHYKPVGQGDEVPTLPLAVAVSLADKMDTIACFFAINEAPTGSKDPFALRRAALGVIRLIVENDLRVSLTGLITCAWSYAVFVDMVNQIRRIQAGTEGPLLLSHLGHLKPHLGFAAKSDLVSYRQADGRVDNWPFSAMPWHQIATSIATTIDPAPVVAFFLDRLKVQQREAGVRHDLIDAVFALGGEDDLVRLLARVHALQAFVTTEDGTNLLAGYKRAANILKKESYPVTPAEAGASGSSAQTPEVPASAGMTSEHDGIAQTGEEDPLAMVDDPDVGDILAEEARANSALSYTPEEAEKALIDALDAAAPRAAAAVEAEKFADAMAALATLRAPIDRFFEEVTVNDADANKRAARLALLARFRDAVHRVADFSRIEG